MKKLFGLLVAVLAILVFAVTAFANPVFVPGTVKGVNIYSAPVQIIHIDDITPTSTDETGLPVAFGKNAIIEDIRVYVSDAAASGVLDVGLDSTITALNDADGLIDGLDVTATGWGQMVDASDNTSFYGPLLQSNSYAETQDAAAANAPIPFIFDGTEFDPTAVAASAIKGIKYFKEPILAVLTYTSPATSSFVFDLYLWVRVPQGALYD